MSEEREIELDVDAVFPPLGSRSGMVRRPDPARPPLRTLPPPPAVPGAARAFERLQEDVDLVVEATSRRLDDMTRRIDVFEHTVRGVLGAQERRVRELEHALSQARARLLAAEQRSEELAADLDRQQTRAHELHARNAVAMARVESLERAALERAGARRAGPPSSATEALLRDDDDGSEPTQRIVRG
ncbi:MAG: hypothetical protein KF729_14260 [Sandaracinaceae bacterium]|nr:hypothetical protein [Sandaracinaceae bacterium]